MALPSGEGEHIWMRVKKDGANTAFVTQRIAEYAGVKENDVGNVEQGRLMVSREIRINNQKMKGIYLSAVRTLCL